MRSGPERDKMAVSDPTGVGTLGRPKRRQTTGSTSAIALGDGGSVWRPMCRRVTGRNETDLRSEATVGALVGGTSISATSVFRALTSTVRRLQL